MTKCKVSELWPSEAGGLFKKCNDKTHKCITISEIDYTDPSSYLLLMSLFLPSMFALIELFSPIVQWESGGRAGLGWRCRKYCLVRVAGGMGNLERLIGQVVRRACLCVCSVILISV